MSAQRLALGYIHLGHCLLSCSLVPAFTSLGLRHPVMQVPSASNEPVRPRGRPLADGAILVYINRYG